MANILLVYGSTTGNAESVAQQISQGLADQNPTIKNVTDTKAEDLLAADWLILGSSTWDDGQLQPDFRDFVGDLNVNLAGKKIAVFGLGDSSYPDFCQAATILEQTFTDLGGQKMIETLRIDGFPDDEANQTKINDWLIQLKSIMATA